MSTQTNESWRAALVVTTINKGGFLKEYYQAILREELLDRVTVIVIPDLENSGGALPALQGV